MEYLVQLSTFSAILVLDKIKDIFSGRFVVVRILAKQRGENINKTQN